MSDEPYEPEDLALPLPKTYRYVLRRTSSIVTPEEDSFDEAETEAETEAEAKAEKSTRKRRRTSSDDKSSPILPESSVSPKSRRSSATYKVAKPRNARKRPKYPDLPEFSTLPQFQEASKEPRSAQPPSSKTQPLSKLADDPKGSEAQQSAEDTCTSVDNPHPEDAKKASNLNDDLASSQNANALIPSQSQSGDKETAASSYPALVRQPLSAMEEPRQPIAQANDILVHKSIFDLQPLYYNAVPAPSFFAPPTVIRPNLRNVPLPPPPLPKHQLPAHLSAQRSATIEAEINFLRGPEFDPSYLCVVPDLTQVFHSLIGAFGDPESGLVNTHFGQKRESSNDETFFPSSKKMKIDPDSYLCTGRSNNANNNKDRKDNKNNTTATATIKTSFPTTSSTGPTTYQGRKYSLHPTLRSRNLEILMFKTRIPHSELLSLKLTPDSRRDAINIADNISSFQSSHFGAVERDAGPSNGLSWFQPQTKTRFKRNDNTNDTLGPHHVPTVKGLAGGQRTVRLAPQSNITNPRTGSRKRNSDPSVWIAMSDGTRKRRRESDSGRKRDKQVERARELRRSMRLRRAADEGRLNEEVARVAEREGRVRMGLGLGLGQPGVIVDWRIIRIAAVVERMGQRCVGRPGVEVVEEVDCSWWAVPERALGGLF